MSVQAPAAVVMVRPHHFRVNSQTASDNYFQSSNAGSSAEQLASQAYEEITAAAAALSAAGVQVHLFEDDAGTTPDSVFPNNWFSTHAGGRVAVYPMKAENRRRERREDILQMLKRSYRVQEVIDYSGLEQDGQFLEGTGAMVLDHLQRVAYTAQSDRASQLALQRFCSQFDYEALGFRAEDQQGNAIYHTNVLMCLGTKFALIGLDMLPDPEERETVLARLQQSGREVISLSAEQITAFAGNAIELQGLDERILALSATAHVALSHAQRQQLSASVRLLPLAVPAIEAAGGSVRCTIAGIHLARRE